MSNVDVVTSETALTACVPFVGNIHGVCNAASQNYFQYFGCFSGLVVVPLCYLIREPSVIDRKSVV